MRSVSVAATCSGLGDVCAGVGLRHRAHRRDRLKLEGRRGGGHAAENGVEGPALSRGERFPGKAKGAGSQEETALRTNLEAAHEVARQLRLRDIGGLVVVDFIDMRASKNRRKVERALAEAVKADKARITLGRLSPNGLLEINRQRIRQALHLRTHRPCPTCGGTGRTATPEMVGLNLLRRIEARAAAP